MTAAQPRRWRAALAAALLAVAVAAALPATSADAGPVEAHVVGGEEVPAESWPWVVALVDRADVDPTEPHCAGSYLGEGWVLTAAHCVADDDAGPFDLLAGDPDVQRADVRVPITDVRVHPGFDGLGALTDDVALVRGSEPLGITRAVLATPAQWPASAPGTLAQVAGWGETEPDGGGAPTQLHAADTPVLAHIDCADAVGEGYAAARTVCAGGEGAGTCFGDSGGPLVGQDAGGSAVQIGVVSSSVDTDEAACGAAPDLYAAVPAYLGWIEGETGLALRSGEPLRVGGDDGVATSVAVSRHAFAPGQAEVFVAAEGGFADGLAGGALAAMRGPLLLVPGEGPLPAGVAGELERLAPQQITVLGGTAAVAADVVAALEEVAEVAQVRRLAGADRYATASAVAAAWRETSTVVVATGERFPDALAAVPLAAHRGPILLTRTDALPGATAARIAERAPERAIVVGGPSAVSDGVVAELEQLVGEVRRVSGADRYATAAAVATDAQNWQDPPFVYAARGDDHRAALPAGVAASFNASPLVLLPPGEVADPVLDRAATVGAERAVTVGDGITDATARALQARLETD